MRMLEIPLVDVHAGKNWKANFVEGGDPNNPEMEETKEFSSTDMGVFSGVLKFADGSRHPALILKAFEHEGGTVGSFVYTRMGWMSLQSEGIMRVLGKYSHDIFPYDGFLANPAELDAEVGNSASEHRKVFQDSLEHIKALRYDQLGTATRRRLIPGQGGQ